MHQPSILYMSLGTTIPQVFLIKQENQAVIRQLKQCIVLGTLRRNEDKTTQSTAYSIDIPTTISVLIYHSNNRERGIHV